VWSGILLARCLDWWWQRSDGTSSKGYQWLELIKDRLSLENKELKNARSVFNQKIVKAYLSQ
jgi:hypothetical protein